MATEQTTMATEQAKKESPRTSIFGDIATSIGGKILELFGKDGKKDEEDDVTVEDEVEDTVIEAIRQEYSRIKPAAQFKCGPILRFQDIHVRNKRWTGSVLIVTDKSTPPPRLVIRDTTKKRVGYSTARHLETWQGNHFYRYDIQLTLMAHRQKHVEYWFESENGRRVKGQPSQQWNFNVPALDEGFHWAFYSCNGFTSDVDDPETNFGGANPLWDDLLVSHDRKPFHALVGGGDQIYNDDVLATPEMHEWLGMESEARISAEYNTEKRYA
ncbi:hypothetical protein BGW38_001460, partial [Lunasporangiospora selenospora]